MKKHLYAACALTLFVFAASTYGLNIGVDSWTTKTTFLDNEDVELIVNVTNNEVSLSPKNVSLIVKVENTLTTIPLEGLSAEKNILKKINLGEFKSGTYRVEFYVEYDFFGVVDKTQTQYQQIRVLPSEPIRMKLDLIAITSVHFPKKIENGKEFELELQINSSTDEGFVEFSINDKDPKTKDLKQGLNEIRKTYKIDKAGIYSLEIKTYTKNDGQISIKDYRTESLIVTDPSIFEPIRIQKVDQDKGNVSIAVGKKSDKNLIQDVGCFLVGGCNGDLIGPEISEISISRFQGKYVFSILADDSKNGNSVIDSCFVRFESENWSLMGAVDGHFDSSVERAALELSTNAVGERNAEFECKDRVGNVEYAAFKAELGCKDDKECSEDEVCSNYKCEKAKLIIAFVPVNWDGDLSTFTTVAEGEASIFREVTPLKDCPNKVKAIMIPEVCNIDCSKGVDLVQIEKSCVERWTYSYDYAVALTNNAVCKENAMGGGFCCGPKSVFVEVYSDKGSVVTAHELGHQFGLSDEYCYSPSSKYNPTTEDLCPFKGCCRPMEQEQNTKSDNWYEYCKWHYNPPSWCNGNKNMAGGNCIMGGGSYPLGFCQYCYNHLKTLPQFNCEAIQ